MTTPSPAPTSLDPPRGAGDRPLFASAADSSAGGEPAGEPSRPPGPDRPWRGMLDGVRVLDLSGNLPGPYLSLLLAELGADVITVEKPGAAELTREAPPLVPPSAGRSGPAVGAMYLALHRNKRSLTLDLKTPEGGALLRRLIGERGYDVLIEGFRPGVMARLGLDYPTLSASYPRLILASISGYGQSGPLRHVAGHDIGYLALAGILHLLRPVDGGPPITPGVQLADVAGGSLFGLAAVLAALFQRERTGRGMGLDIGMSPHAAALAPLFMGIQQASTTPVPPGDFLLWGRYPCYRVYATKDGGAMAVGALEPKFWQNFCATIDRPHLLGAAYADGEAGTAAIAELADMFASRTRDEWTALFAATDACVEPVLAPHELPTHPRSPVRDAFHTVEHPRLGLVSVMDVFPAFPRRPPTPPPDAGEHTAAILADLGVSGDELAALRRRGVVG